MDLKREIDPENPDVLIVEKIVQERICLPDVEKEIYTIQERITLLEKEGKDFNQEYLGDGALQRADQLREAITGLESIRDEITKKRGG